MLARMSDPESERAAGDWLGPDQGLTALAGDLEGLRWFPLPGESIQS